MSATVKAILKALSYKKQTLAVAESCTGGMVSSYLTQEEGASLVFQGAIVCYTEDIKERLMGVSPQLLREKTAVSKEVALELAKNMSEKFQTHWACSVTGWAGPTGGDEENPVGTVYFGFLGPDLATTKRRVFPNPSRLSVQKEATKFVLEELENYLTK